MQGGGYDMVEYFRENWGNILVLALIAMVMIAVVWSQKNGRKNGKSGCRCGCGGCPSKGICHPNS